MSPRVQLPRPFVRGIQVRVPGRPRRARGLPRYAGAICSSKRPPTAISSRSASLQKLLAKAKLSAKTSARLGNRINNDASLHVGQPASHGILTGVQRHIRSRELPSSRCARPPRGHINVALRALRISLPIVPADKRSRNPETASREKCQPPAKHRHWPVVVAEAPNIAFRDRRPPQIRCRYWYFPHASRHSDTSTSAGGLWARDRQL